MIYYQWNGMDVIVLYKLLVHVGMLRVRVYLGGGCMCALMYPYRLYVGPTTSISHSENHNLLKHLISTPNTSLSK